MEFVDIPFPERIAFQAKAEPAWQTELTALLSGYEATNQSWVQSRHYYDAGLAVRVASDYRLVKAHFNTMRGRAKSFPFRDPVDHTVAASAGFLVERVAGGWQLVYRYGSGSEAYDRNITRPKTGTVRIFRDRLGVVTDVTGSASISYTTGVVATMSGDQSDDAYTWSGEFYVPCRYDIDKLPGVIVNKQPGPAGELFVECESIPIVEVRE